MKPLITVGIGLLTLGTLAFAQMNMNGQNDMGQNQTMLGQMSMPGMNHQMMGGMSGMLQMMGGMNAQNIDRNFLTMMIPHHQSAIDMSQLVLKTTKDPQVKIWATNIIRDQQREIDQMQTLLKQYDGPVQGMGGQMNKMMGDMSGPINKASNKDIAFVQGMLPHHGMAIMMADHLLMQSKNPMMQKLGHDIITAQAQEMFEFQKYLNKTK